MHTQLKSIGNSRNKSLNQFCYPSLFPFCFIGNLSIIINFAGKFINGTVIIADGGLWLSRPRHLPKDAVKQLSRSVEKRSRDAPVGVPRSKL